MNPEKTEILKKYIKLENKVFKLMSSICSKYCANCKVTCCTPVICKDILKSKWLFNVVRFTKKIETAKDLNNILNQHFHSGCESEKPCPFKSGRPVICGRYFCKDITKNLQSDFIHFLLFQLADIIPTFLDVKINKKKILNLDLNDKSVKLSDENYQSIKKNLNLALKKYNIIKKYIVSSVETVDGNTMFKDLLLLEKQSRLSILETISD